MSADQKTLIDVIIREVAELPDRTSPDDWPDAMLVTADELRAILEARLSVPICGACGQPWTGEACGQQENGWPFPVCYPVGIESALVKE